MASVISGDANVSAAEFGYLDGVTSALQTQMDAKLPIAGGKILQIVRATDATQRATSSTSFVDVTGMAVTITPQKSDSAILLLCTARLYLEVPNSGDQRGFVRITDSSNNAISGTQELGFGTNAGTYSAGTNETPLVIMAYATPATTSAVTYKARFRSAQASVATYFRNDQSTGQMYAIEVSA